MTGIRFYCLYCPQIFEHFTRILEHFESCHAKAKLSFGEFMKQVATGSFDSELARIPARFSMNQAYEMIIERRLWNG